MIAQVEQQVTRPSRHSIQIDHWSKVRRQPERVLLWDIIKHMYPKMDSFKYPPIPDPSHTLGVDNLSLLFFRVFKQAEKTPSRGEIIRILCLWDQELKREGLGTIKDFVVLSTSSMSSHVASLVNDMFNNPCFLQVKK